jgi:CheY-like chemotaxis protein
MPFRPKVRPEQDSSLPFPEVKNNQADLFARTAKSEMFNINIIKMEKKKILLVDDDIDYLAQMEAQIKTFGFDVITAENREDALKVLADTKPDLAIIDLMMESQDSGFILAYKCKQLYPDVPVAIATAVTRETGLRFDVDRKADRDWIKADLFMEKGIRSDQLHREINRLLRI